MIPPGFLVAVTLASAHAPSPGPSLGSAPASSRTALKEDSSASTVPGDFGSILADLGTLATAPESDRVEDGTFDLGATLAWPGITPSLPVETPTLATGDDEAPPLPDEEPETQPAIALEIVSSVEQPVEPPVAVPQTLPTGLLEAAADTVTLDPRMTRGLSMGFVARLSRVAERLWNEHGLRLEVVEGFRSEARQADLFMQGRTEPGPVVTWTTKSLHSTGSAADVFIAGAPVSQENAPLLARVAREEGLRTLYPLDSGHIQLDGPGGETGPEGPLARRVPDPLAPPTPPRKGVAPVAPVAPVAKPARVGGTTSSGEPASGGRQAKPLVAELANVEASRVSAGAEVGPTENAVRRKTREAVHGDSGLADAQPVTAGSDRRDAPPSASLRAPPGLAGAAPGGALTSVALDPERFEARLALTNIRSVHLPMEGLGEGASLQVGMRGATVDARLSVPDPLVAADLREAFHELRQQLGSRGLDSGEIEVHLVSENKTGALLRPGGLGDPGALHMGSSAGRTASDSDTFGSRLPRQGEDPADVRERGSRTKRDNRKEKPE